MSTIISILELIYVVYFMAMKKKDIKTMKKKDIKEVWSTYTEAARAIGITKGAITNWPEVLSPIQRDRVIAAALREGKPIPKHWLQREESA